MSEKSKYAAKYPEPPNCPHCGNALTVSVCWESRLIHMDCPDKACGYGCNLFQEDIPEFLF